MGMLALFSCVAALGLVGAHSTSSVWSTGPADPEAPLVVALAVRQLNLETLEEHFRAVSDPTGTRRGKYLSFREVGELVRNPKATQAVKAWARSEELDVVDETSFGEYVLIRGPVRRLGQVFSTTFEQYRSPLGEKRLACSGVTVPKALQPHLVGILGAIHTPLQRFGNWGAVRHSAGDMDLPVPTGLYPLPGPFNGTMTPQKIKSFYNVDQDLGSPSIIQDIFSDGQTYDLSDLQAFRAHFGLDTSDTPENEGTMPQNNCSCNATQGWLSCMNSLGMCGEASLDVQYLSGVGQMMHTRVHNYNDGNLTEALAHWITDAANRTDSDLALVHSISYGISESLLKDLGLVTAFNTEAMKLGVRGVSIFVASGDGGVCDGHGSAECSYQPVFPASSPYVTAVGGTMGPETGLPERVMNVADGGTYTAGGGFSDQFPTPAYQQQAVSAYLQSAAGKSAALGYNSSNRAYPDLTFASNNFEIVIGGSLFPMMSGTSAAAPSLAALFSLVNARRRARGSAAVGFVNPTLYAAGPQGCCNDIVQGANTCMRQPEDYPTCAQKCMAPHVTWAGYSECSTGCLDASCKVGFPATEGWDPASGLGSPDFQKLLHLFDAKEETLLV